MATQFKVINGQIIRSPKRGAVRYTPISNSVLQNKNLSFEARGLLSYILSLPEDWVLVKSVVQREHAGTGTFKFNKIWEELKQFGYIESEKVRDPLSGKFLGWCHMAYEEPIKSTECGKTQCRIIPKSDNHHITKETLLTKKTSIKKKDIQKSVEADNIEASQLRVINSLDKPTLFQIKNGLV